MKCMADSKLRRINIEILAVKGLMWILEPWKNQSNSWKSPWKVLEICFWKRIWTLALTWWATWLVCRLYLTYLPRYPTLQQLSPERTYTCMFLFWSSPHFSGNVRFTLQFSFRKPHEIFNMLPWVSEIFPGSEQSINNEVTLSKWNLFPWHFSLDIILM